MFFHKKTMLELITLRNYLKKRKAVHAEDAVDHWIRMVATNRLTGHSSGFFSVYTLPPNQAVNRERQKKINAQRKQKPEYRNVAVLIGKKSRVLQSGLNREQKDNIHLAASTAQYLFEDAASTNAIRSNSVHLTVTSPPFLDIVQYARDNWLRCWFNNIDVDAIAKKITMSRTVEEWVEVMQKVFHELYRITKKGGYVAFETGEVRKGEIFLDTHVLAMGEKAGFIPEKILINTHAFTKTANIWGVHNNSGGTNSNRVVLFRKS
ncbi:MAG: DNA methyltransferase [Chitinophagales bacterium]